MKTLKESILSSTKTGKDLLIKQWCDKYLQYWCPIDGDTTKYLITNNLKKTLFLTANSLLNTLLS